MDCSTWDSIDPPRTLEAVWVVVGRGSITLSAGFIVGVRNAKGRLGEVATVSFTLGGTLELCVCFAKSSIGVTGSEI